MFINGQKISKKVYLVQQSHVGCYFHNDEKWQCWFKKKEKKKEKKNKANKYSQIRPFLLSHCLPSQRGWAGIGHWPQLGDLSIVPSWISEEAKTQMTIKSVVSRTTSPLTRTVSHNKSNDWGIDAWSTGPFAYLFARSLAPLTHLLAPHCFLRSQARPLTRAQAHGKVNDSGCSDP